MWRVGVGWSGVWSSVVWKKVIPCKRLLMGKGRIVGEVRRYEVQVEEGNKVL